MTLSIHDPTGQFRSESRTIAKDGSQILLSFAQSWHCRFGAWYSSPKLLYFFQSSPLGFGNKEPGEDCLSKGHRCQEPEGESLPYVVEGRREEQNHYGIGNPLGQHRNGHPDSADTIGKYF